MRAHDSLCSRTRTTAVKAHLALVAATVLLAACTADVSAPPSPASPSPSATPAVEPSPTASAADLVKLSVGDRTFSAPASWQMVRPRRWTAPVGPILFLSDAPIADPCPVVFLDAGCWKPLEILPANGIVVMFSGAAVLSPPNPSPMPREIEVRDWCKEIGGEREMSTNFPGCTIEACMRGPDMATNESLFVGLVSSVTL